MVTDMGVLRPLSRRRMEFGVEALQRMGVDLPPPQ